MKHPPKSKLNQYYWFLCTSFSPPKIINCVHSTANRNLAPIQNVVGICKHITIFNFTTLLTQPILTKNIHFYTEAGFCASIDPGSMMIIM